MVQRLTLNVFTHAQPLQPPIIEVVFIFVLGFLSVMIKASPVIKGPSFSWRSLFEGMNERHELVPRPINNGQSHTDYLGLVNSSEICTEN